MSSSEHLAKRIENLVKSRNTTVNTMLLDCGINSSFMTGLRRGSSPSVDKILKIANYLDVTLEYLVTGRESKETSSTLDQQELLILWNKLDPIKQAEFKGEIKGYIKAKEEKQASGG